jgi:hypothetical protein
MAKIQYVVMLENVIHPESRATLLHEGEIYSTGYITRIHLETGMDNIKCYFCLTRAAAIEMAKRFANDNGKAV